MIPGMPNCREMTELATDYVEGRMPFWRRMFFQYHIGMCQHCRAYLVQMRLTIQAVGKLPDEPMPDPVRDAILKSFRQTNSNLSKENGGLE